MPRYWTGFDVVVNIVGYIPLGMLFALALYPRLRGIWGDPGAAILGMLVSGTMEAVQTYLPSRVPSNLDFFTNSLGGLIGALHRRLSARAATSTKAACTGCASAWFAPHASQGLVLLALWPLAQIYPQRYLFGHGQVLPILSDWLSRLLDTDIDLVAMLRPGAGHERRAVLAVGDHHHRLRHDRRRADPAVPDAPRRARARSWSLALLIGARWCSSRCRARCCSRPTTPSSGLRRAPRAAS